MSVPRPEWRAAVMFHPDAVLAFLWIQKIQAGLPEKSGSPAFSCLHLIPYFTNRYRITANWAREAVPAGFRVPWAVPPTISFFTDQAMASLA